MFEQSLITLFYYVDPDEAAELSPEFMSKDLICVKVYQISAHFYLY